MLIIDWAPITATEEIPPLGDKLREHLSKRKGAVLHGSCSAWGLLYRLMEQNGIEADTVAFTEKGKPYFENSGIYFSLSHSKGLCAAAISDNPVGIDVEQCRESYNPHLVERSLTEKEKAVFDGDFTRIWCCKEATAKMTGEGIVGYPANIETTGRSFVCQKLSHNGQEYRLAAIIFCG